MYHNRTEGCGKPIFLTNFILNFINEYDKIYVYSPSLHPELDQKLNKCFSNWIPIHIIANFINGDDIDLVIDDIVDIEDFQKSYCETETFDGLEELKYPQEYENDGKFILDDPNGKERNNSRVQAAFKRSKHNNLSIFMFSQGYYELPKTTIRANGNIYHIFKPNKFRDVQKLYQDKASMDMTLDEFNYLTNTCRKGKYQTLPIDMAKDKLTRRYRLGLISIIAPDSFPFYIN